MSPVVDLQRRMRELGRIRMGDKGGANGAQRRLDKFRLTSPSEGILQAAAAIYGGQVQPWDGAPDPPQFELYTDAAVLRVAIPPTDEPYSQWYELWSGAGCQRRCTGQVATVVHGNGFREVPCVCASNGQEGADRECNLTTRAPFILPEVPGIGVWRLESKGYNAATKLTGTLMYLAMQAGQGVYIEAELRLEQKSKRVPGQPVNRWVEPVLDTPNTTIGQLMSGAGSMPTGPSIEPPVGRPALPATTAAPPSGDDAGFTDPAAPAPSVGTWGSPPPPPTGEAAMRGEVQDDDGLITEAQRRRLFAIAKESGVTTAYVKSVVMDLTGQDSTKKIPRDKYESVVETVQAGPAADHAAAGGDALFPSERQADPA